MDNYLDINPNMVLTDASDIEAIINTMTADMETLDKAFKAEIPSGIDTEWSNQLAANWKGYFSSTIPSTMEDMSKSAANLQMAVQASQQYSKQQG